MSKRKRIALVFLFTCGLWLCHGKLAGDMFVRNYGISLSVFVPFASWLVSLVLVWLMWEYVMRPKYFILLILVGGLVNLIDRINYGYVRDYWQIGPTGIYNNLPDWLIFIGLVGYGLHLSRRRYLSFK